MFDLPTHPMMYAGDSAPGMSGGSPLYAEVANAADMDLGYEVAFPFLTAAEDSGSHATLVASS